LEAETLQIQCALCEKFKPEDAEFWNIEHIIPRKFGNYGDNGAVLEYKICRCCNGYLGKSVDAPFMNEVTSREIDMMYAMKPKNPKTKVTGSGVVVRYKTTIAHLLMCIKIAFETHVKFLDEKYRDTTFHALRQLLLGIISNHRTFTSSIKSKQTFGKIIVDEAWADPWQTIATLKNAAVIDENVFRLDEVTANSDEIVAKVKSRSKKGSYASLIQLGCWNFGIGVMICLQSLPPIVIRVSNKADRYVLEYGCDCIHVMYLRGIRHWVGCENGE